VPLHGKKLGVLISAGPENPSFGHGLRLAEAAIGRGVGVYLYCIDDAVTGLADARLQGIKARGANIFVCAYGAQKRGIPLSDLATFAGLTVVSELVADTDRFVSFN